jgi:hypothetical protein
VLDAAIFLISSYYLEDQDIGGWIILKWILERQDGVVWTGLIWFRIRPVEDSCEHGNDPSGSKNVGKFLSSCTTGNFSRRAQLHGVSIWK